MSRYLMGIDVGGTNIKMMIMTERCHVLNKRSIPTCPEDGYEIISDRIIKSLEELFAEKNVTDPEVLYIAMGLPGTVDRKNSRAIYLSVVGWNGFNPAEKIGRHFNAPVVIDNDANINALGEYAFGSNGSRDLVLLTIGTGIGCGVIINGKIFGGASNMAAEAGHMVIEVRGGRKCLCGKHGHAEAYCSGTALKNDALRMAASKPGSILNEYIRESGGNYDNSMLIRGVNEGDKDCMELFDRFVNYLAVTVANVMLMYNPEIVVIGGGVSNAGLTLLNPLNEKCKEHLMDERLFCPIGKASLGSEAGMYGACALAAQMAGIKYFF